MSKVTIKVKDIKYGNCKDISYYFEHPTKGVVPCEEINGEITIELPGDDTSTCIDLVVQCNDCGGCEPLTRTICTCDNNSDCTDCEYCGSSGFCIDKCPDQVCDDGSCVDCSDEVPCTNGKECQNGKCNCPVDKPFIDPVTGNCVECEEGTVDNCRVCVGGKYQNVDCGDGVCNPDDNTCVECNKAGDCGTNERCVNNECECINGFVKNAQGNCVPAPPCTTDFDCETCEFCNGNNNCQPIECPEGFSPQIVDGECNCVYDPCPNTPCSDGTDCGPDCGCNPTTGMCEPCSEQDCPECGGILGCNCNTSNNTCDKVGDCDTACSTYLDCAEGCGCDDGICKDCSNYSCEDCADVPGCGCNNGKCEDVGDDCSDTLEIKKTDCGIKAELKTDIRCACPVLSFTSVITDIRNGDTITKTGNKADLELVNYKADFLVDLRKGLASTYNAALLLPKLSDTSNEAIVDNDLPQSGSTSLVIQTFYKEIDPETNVTRSSPGPTVDTTQSLANTDTNIYLSAVIDKPGYEISENYFVDYVVVKIYQETLLSFDNGCNYLSRQLINEIKFDESVDVDTMVINDSYSIYNSVKAITSGNSRKPVITWKKSGDTNFDKEDIFRKVYIDNVGGKHTDELFGPGKIPTLDPYPLESTSPEGELWANYNYEVDVDCTCADQTDLINLQVCDIEFVQDVNYEMANCNLTFRGLQGFLPCPINRDLDQYEEAGYTIPADAQTFYELYIDDVLKATYKYSDGLGDLVDIETSIPFSNYTFTSELPIEKVKMSEKGQMKCKVEKTFSTVAPTPRYEFDCSTGNKYVINFNINTNTIGYTVKGVSYNGLLYDTINNDIIAIGNLTRGVEHTFLVNFSNNCTKQVKITDTCCSPDNSSIQVTVDPNIFEGGSATGTIVATNIGTPVTYTLTKGTATIPVAGDGTFTITEAGTYTAKAFSDVCSKETMFTVGEIQNDLEITISDATICSGDSATITITGQPNSAIVYDTPTSTGIDADLNPSGVFTFSATQDGEYKVTSYQGFTVSEIITLTVVPTPVVDNFSIVTGGPYCEDNPITFSVTGTIGASVDVSYTAGISGPAQILLSNGSATFIATPTGTGIQDVTLTEISVGECPDTINLTQQVTVQSSPEIVSVETSCPVPGEGQPTQVVVTANAIGLTVVLNPGGSNEAFTDNMDNTYTLSTNTTGNQTISVSNVSCTITQTQFIQTCTCPFVAPPTISSNFYGWEDSTTAPVISANGNGNTVKWYSDPGLDTLLHTGNTYTPTDSITVYIVAEDGNGCKSNPVVVDLSQFNLVVASVSGTNNDLDPCEGESTTVSTNLSITGDIGFRKPLDDVSELTWEWFSGTGGGGSLLGTGKTQAYAADAGNVSVTVSTKTPFEPYSNTLNFTIGSSVCDNCYGYTMNPVSDYIICSGKTLNIPVTVVGGSANFSYRLLKNGVVKASVLNSSNRTETLTRVIDGTDGGAYVVEVTDANGCTVSDNITLFLQSADITIGDYDHDIGGVQVTLTNLQNANTVNVGVFLDTVWQGNIVTNGGTINSPFNVLFNSGTRDISVNVGNTEDSGACLYTTKSVTYADPECIIGVDDVDITPPTCAGETGSVEVMASGADTYQYRITPGPGTFQDSNIFPGLVEGNYSVEARDKVYPACVSSSLAFYMPDGEVVTGALNTACDADQVDYVFLLDNSSSILAGEYADMKATIESTIDELESNAQDKTYAIVQYRAEGSNNLLEVTVDSTAVAATAKTFSRFGFGNDNLQPTIDLLIAEIGTGLTLRAGSQRVLLIFSDAQTKIYPQDQGSTIRPYTSINTLKSTHNFDVSTIWYKSDPTDDTFVAALASVGGEYTGVVASNAGDPEGSQTTPRKAYFKTEFDGLPVPNLTTELYNCVLSVTGENAGSAYSWSTGATTSQISVPKGDAQEYTVTITTPAGCTKQLSYTNT